MPCLFDRLTADERARIKREDPWLAERLQACAYGRTVRIPWPKPSKALLLTEWRYWHREIGMARWSAAIRVARDHAIARQTVRRAVAELDPEAWPK